MLVGRFGVFRERREAERERKEFVERLVCGEIWAGRMDVADGRMSEDKSVLH